MTPFVSVSTEGALGVITLNRPEAINALDPAMIDAIAVTLAGWRDDQSVRAVLFEGNGPRGFCAGGDVRAMRSAVLAGRLSDADAFFEAEYRLNGDIATYPKPVIALTHGVVMGGGIGLAGHAGFRFATAESRFAMPESAIGFFGDVGANAILAKAPLNRALAFLMSGQAVGAADALVLGLTDCIIAPEARAGIRSALITAAGAQDVDTAIVGVMQAEGIEPGEAGFAAMADALRPAFDQASAEAILAAIAASPDHEAFAGLLASRSPLSLTATLLGHLAARRARDVRAVLAIDLALAKFMIRQPDFAEGVRAVLVDKDHKPAWPPGGFARVPVAGLMQAIEKASSGA